MDYKLNYYNFLKSIKLSCIIDGMGLDLMRAFIMGLIKLYGAQKRKIFAIVMYSIRAEITGSARSESYKTRKTSLNAKKKCFLINADSNDSSSNCYSLEAI